MMEKKTGGRTAGIIIAISIVLLAAVMPAVVSGLIPAYEQTCLGWRPLAVRTNSMEGTIRKNAVILVFAAKWESLKVGDIITFQRSDGQLDTHRIITKDGAHISTKGDNTSAPDPGWVTPDSYKYKVMFIWNWAAWLSDNRAAAYLICLPFLLVGLVSAGVLFAGRASRRRKPLQEENAQAELVPVECPQEPMPPDDTQIINAIQADAEEDSYLDEMLSLLESTCRQEKNAKDKENPHEPETRKATSLPVADDDDGSATDWALLQLQQSAASPGDALPADGRENRAGALSGKSASDGQPVSPPGRQRVL